MRSQISTRFGIHRGRQRRCRRPGSRRHPFDPHHTRGIATDRTSTPGSDHTAITIPCRARRVPHRLRTCREAALGPGGVSRPPKSATYGGRSSRPSVIVAEVGREADEGDLSAKAIQQKLDRLEEAFLFAQSMISRPTALTTNAFKYLTATDNSQNEVASITGFEPCRRETPTEVGRQSRSVLCTTSCRRSRRASSCPRRRRHCS